MRAGRRILQIKCGWCLFQALSLWTEISVPAVEDRHAGYHHHPHRDSWDHKHEYGECLCLWGSDVIPDQLILYVLSHTSFRLKNWWMDTFLRNDDALLNNDSAETSQESTYFCLLPSLFSTSCVLLLPFLCLLAIPFVTEMSTEKNFYFRQEHV